KKYTYKIKNINFELSQEKVNDLVKMYDKFLDPNLRPEWLPISQSVTPSSYTSATSPSSNIARQHRSELKKRKKAKKSLK
ncbi:hypothetical protein MHK_002418, partial [Candidatus Magnetomorum sp. HK-1]